MNNEAILKPLPIGISFFDAMIEKKYYYVDKTLFIKELIDNSTGVNLFTRPRRFGKTLNMRMLQCFFEDTKKTTGINNAPLFDGLKIMSAGENYTAHIGIYPVVFLTFKDAGQSIFEHSFSFIKTVISDEYNRHSYVLEDTRLSGKKEKYERIMCEKGDMNDYSQSLKFLCECLSVYHGKNTIVLIDEYDVPLEASWSNNYYSAMVNFVHPLLSFALKDNPFLEFSVITGCLRISKESIFSGLNNLGVNSICGANYTEYFGFVHEEVNQILSFYALNSHFDTIKKWYNGYLFGNTEVYNPWSLINVVKDLFSDPARSPEPYWVNTSSNNIVRSLIDKADNDTRSDLDTLIAGGAIKKYIHEDITYNEIEKDINNIWNFLFFTGYLKKVGEHFEGDNKLYLDLKIPNIELQYIFETKIQEWFKESFLPKNDLSKMHAAVLNGDEQIFQKELSSLLMKCISFYDNQENSYHGFLTGVLSGVDGYIVKSNRESGNGRSDVVMSYANFDGKVIIFELKAAKTVKEMSACCEAALSQIEEKQYEQEWLDEGYTDILKYGISFYKKNCMVRCKTCTG
ncbi:MAG: AAA family ATPase [Termitinemataceae bacterium]|nr:MAG: AAA family ATPase [Termitinemataceae bacterium]